jgi:glycosyltransferase involved in cell wall biosynthesis
MTADLPLVSIVTPVFNGAKYLDELIQSILSQDYPNIEHLIIDDGSTDNGATITVLARYSHLRWWSRENRGQYATMNEGLAAARGEFVCFVSADDLVTPGAVRHVVEFMRQHPEDDGITGLTQYVNEKGECYVNPPFQTAPIRYYAYLFQISHCSLYLKREQLIRDNLLFDPGLHYVGDYDWILRVLGKLRIYQDSSYLSSVRIHEAQTSILHRRKMLEEQRRVIANRRINPMAFEIGRDLYIGIHDLKKLHYALRKKGLKGGMQLVLDHLHREKE